MTITVTAPNGATVDFPDGTDHATINGVMMQHFRGGEAAPPPDKYQQAAQSDYESNPAMQSMAGYTRRLAHGATLGADTTLLAGLETPLEMIKRGTFSPAEGYNYAKAREDLIMNKARENTGLLGTGAEILGGGLSGAGLASAGLTASRFLAPGAGIIKRTLASAADAAGLGGFSGAMEGNGLAERATNAIKGAAIGGVIGTALPAVAGLARGALAPVVANIRAKVNPEGFGDSMVARGVHDSGLTPDQIDARVMQAAAEGQGVFNRADAMGDAGQNMLGAAARGPGTPRTAIVNSLESRQAGQADRVKDIVDETLGVGGTARQASAQLTRRAINDSAPLYERAFEQQPVWSPRMQQFLNDPVAKKGLREGVDVQRLESLASGKPFNPHDYAITDFNAAGDPVISGVPNMRTIDLIKKGWDAQLEKYRDPTTGKLALDAHGRALDSVRRSFLKEVDTINPDYGAARSLYAGPSQVKNAVGFGQNSVTRGRAADNIDQFNALNAPSQQGFRTGYADKIAARIERAAGEGTNTARPLTSQKARQEIEAMALDQGPLRPDELTPFARKLGREMSMHKGMNTALGGSPTAKNLAHDQAMSISPHLVGQILTGNVHGAIRSVLAAGHNALTGNTPAVRQRVAEILLQNGQTMTPGQLRNMVQSTVARIAYVNNIARNVQRGAAGGLAVAAPGQQQRR